MYLHQTFTCPSRTEISENTATEVTLIIYRNKFLFEINLAIPSRKICKMLYSYFKMAKSSSELLVDKIIAHCL
jgi:hypothetical protein